MKVSEPQWANPNQVLEIAQKMECTAYEQMTIFLAAPETQLRVFSS